MRIKNLIASAMIVGTGLLLVPGVASAALSDCDANKMCLWGNNDYKWMLNERDAGSSTIQNLSGDANDEMDSWANKSSTYSGCMWSDANGSGDRQTLGRNQSDNNVSPANSDEVSSWRTAYSC
ncbi:MULTISPECIES: peptidase inhibitor family I36 protein [Micromonospora]|uniref:Peptidase inhibitor family I36 protein n=1 Tax=Micromonospora azadirachtae TaxID=1970735 RepID=A0ABW2ZWY6_9ACTN